MDIENSLKEQIGIINDVSRNAYKAGYEAGVRDANAEALKGLDKIGKILGQGGSYCDVCSKGNEAGCRIGDGHDCDNCAFCGTEPMDNSVDCPECEKEHDPDKSCLEAGVGRANV